MTDEAKKALAIANQRKRCGLSQAALAKLAGTSQQTVDRIERGETLHSRATTRIVAVLNREELVTKKLPRALGEPLRTSADIDAAIPHSCRIDPIEVGGKMETGLFVIEFQNDYLEMVIDKEIAGTFIIALTQFMQGDKRPRDQN